MTEKILKSRIPQKIDTTENWERSSLILKKGEIGIEELTNGSKKIKIGDGKSNWKNLLYFGSSIDNIADGIANGSIRTILSTQEGVEYKLGEGSFAEGLNTKASGRQAHAEGNATNAEGNMSHAEGYNTQAKGGFSHVEGKDSIASGSASHANGLGVIAKGANQTAIGKYNIQDDTNEFAFVVGNGTSDGARANAFTVDWTGVVKANDKNLATEEFASANGGKIDSIKVNGQNLTIEEKSVNIKVPTKTSELSNDSGFLTEQQDISGKADLTQVVRHDEAQSLSESAKAQARTNIGAGTSNFDGQFSSLSDAPTTLKGYGITDGITPTEVDTKISAEIGKLDKADTAVEGEYISAITQENGVVSVQRKKLPAGGDYTVTVEETTPEGYAKGYNIKQEATGLNVTINIPRDMVVKSGTVEKKTISGEWGLAGTYLVLTLANATSDKIYIDVSTLIEYVTSGSVSTDMVQIAISQDHKVTATIKDGSISKAKLDASVQASLGKADTALQSVPNASTSTNGLMLAADKTKLDGIAAGAEVNVQADWNVSDSESDAFIKNKPTNLAKTDLTNIDNSVFKQKVTNSGFTSGTQVIIKRWEESD